MDKWCVYEKLKERCREMAKTPQEYERFIMQAERLAEELTERERLKAERQSENPTPLQK